MAERRVMVIGLDGGTWTVLDRFMEFGFMPNLKRLCAEGYKGVLRSTVPALTPTAWTTFATGMNPGKHGVFGFRILHVTPGEYLGTPARRDRIPVPSLWKRLSDAGKRCTVLSVPVTYPAETINGSLVTGMFTPSLESACTYPPALKHELLSHGCMPRFQTEVLPTPKGGWEIPRTEDAMDITDKLRRAALYLMEKRWDFMMMVFVGTDRLQHTNWPDIEAIGLKPDAPLRRRLVDFYRDLDDAIGKLVEAAGPETVVLMMSDHGFGPSEGFFMLAEWLIERGYAVRPRRGLRLLRGLTSRLGIGKLLRGHASERARAKMASVGASVDYPQSHVYPFSGGHGVRINLRGREKHGIVEPGREFEDLRHELKERLLDIRLPHDDGKPVFSQAWFGEELYEGAYLEWAPDVVVRPNPDLGYTPRASKGSEAALVEVDPFHPGDHREEGIFLAWGPGVVPNASAPPAHIADLAPTVLRLLGEPVPTGMDGHVPEKAFEPGVAAASKQRPAAERIPEAETPEGEPGQYSEQEQRAIEKRLRDLGYL